RPDGYLGKNHETIGSDLLAVQAALEELSATGQKSSLPEQVLGADLSRRLKGVRPDGWYPISWLLDLMAQLEPKLSRYGLIKMGRTLFRMSHRDRVLQVAHSARDIVYGI